MCCGKLHMINQVCPISFAITNRKIANILRGISTNQFALKLMKLVKIKGFDCIALPWTVIGKYSHSKLIQMFKKLDYALS